MNLAFTVVRSHPKLTFSEAAQLKSVLSKLLSLWRALANTVKAGWRQHLTQYNVNQ